MWIDVISREGQRINDGNYIRIQDLDVPWFVNIYPHLVWEWLRCAGMFLHLWINPDFVVSIERSWYCQWNLAKVWCRIIVYHWYHELERQRIRGFGTFALASTDPSYREAPMLSLHFTKSREVKRSQGNGPTLGRSWNRQMVDTMDTTTPQWTPQWTPRHHWTLRPGRYCVCHCFCGKSLSR